MQHRLPTLVLAASGKTGRRVADRLEARGLPVRRGSRSGDCAARFDWDDRATWAPALAGVGAVYVVYTPDLAVPEAPGDIEAFAALAREQGVTRLVLLSGRGEEAAQRCERIVAESGLAWTVVRASWFAQNFDEGAFAELVAAGEVALPTGDVREPFVDVDDVADVAVAALTEGGHSGRVYEVTGPRLMTFADAVAEIATATGRDVRYLTRRPTGREVNSYGSRAHLLSRQPRTGRGRNRAVRSTEHRRLRPFPDRAKPCSRHGLLRARRS